MLVNIYNQLIYSTNYTNEGLDYELYNYKNCFNNIVVFMYGSS